jgi:hypothetical protein
MITPLLTKSSLVIVFDKKHKIFIQCIEKNVKICSIIKKSFTCL